MVVAGRELARDLAGAGMRVALLARNAERLEGVATPLREQGAEVPILLSSGYSESETRSSFEGAGPSAFLQKPFTVGSLTRAVVELLGGAARELNLLPVLMGNLRIQGILVGNKDQGGIPALPPHTACPLPCGHDCTWITHQDTDV